MATLSNCKATTFPTGNFRENICDDPHNLPQIQLASFLVQPASTRLLSPGPISRRWKRQSMPALSCPIPSQISVWRDKGWYGRFGSEPDICVAKSDVRFTPESGLVQCTSESRLRPIADIVIGVHSEIGRKPQHRDLGRFNGGRDLPLCDSELRPETVDHAICRCARGEKTKV